MTGRCRISLVRHTRRSTPRLAITKFRIRDKVPVRRNFRENAECVHFDSGVL